MKMDENILEGLIKKVIAEELEQNKGNSKYIDESGVGVVKLNQIVPEKFDTGKPGDDVKLVDIYSLKESPRLGCGLMEMKETTFDWTLTYDEVDYIIDGTLEIIIDGRKVVGHKGDVILIPKDTHIQFSVPEYAKFLYVVYPANWQEQQ